ncbi:hypothetical protein WR25_12129 [Diploscapter pachys]|uniref:Uncharacterized protein n=1 Tax=Diploscapter pachys TaxID=2018661 RepID=A0A2A2JXK5_9BILA|nr:hypothetical protein WR25_12129 [Diploscapter pachys]
MNLRNRRRRDRLAVEVREHISDRGAERGQDRRLQRLERQRGHAILQRRQRPHPFRPEQVFAGGEHLPQLDRDRSKVSQQRDDPLGRTEVYRLL